MKLPGSLASTCFSEDFNYLYPFAQEGRITEEELTVPNGDISGEENKIAEAIYFFSVYQKIFKSMFVCMHTSVLNLVSRGKTEFLNNRFYLPIIYKGYCDHKGVKDTGLRVKFFYLHAGV